jgi:hypothetical protein
MGEQYDVRESQTHEPAKVTCFAPLGLRDRPATFAVMVMDKGVSYAHSDPQPQELIPCHR